MTIKRFEDLIAWQKSQDLAVDIDKTFSDNKDFSFKDQILRASVSISNNVAEGFNRNSNKEFKRFLSIAQSSCSELKSMIYLAFKISYIDKETEIMLISKSEEVSKIIRGLSNSLKV